MADSCSGLSGYDYEFREPGPTDDQKCPICHLVVRNAHQVICCGKLMCEYCLMRNLQFRKDCPMCRGNIGDKYFKDTKSDREIKELEVVCSNLRAGCTWQGTVGSVETHLNECKYQEVTCQKCKAKMLNRNLQKHMSNSCPMRKHKCPHCKKEGTYRSITTEHKKTCPEAMVVCKNAGCRKQVKRHQMALHVKKCPKEIIDCPFNRMGCEFKSVRENLTDHIERQVGRHVDLIAHSNEPAVVKMTNFNQLKKDNKKWSSNGFNTGPGGYKVRLVVYPNGNGDGKSTHMSVFVNVMPGDNDDTLEFPMRGKFTVEVLNQSEDKDHCSYTIPFDAETPEKCACRKYSVDPENSLGFHNFISHSSLDKYLKNDTVYFRVTADVHSETKPWLAVTVV